MFAFLATGAECGLRWGLSAIWTSAYWRSFLCLCSTCKMTMFKLKESIELHCNQFCNRSWGRLFMWPWVQICTRTCAKDQTSLIPLLIISVFYIVLGAQERVIIADRVLVSNKAYLFLDKDIWMCKMKEQSFIWRSFALTWKQYFETNKM